MSDDGESLLERMAKRAPLARMLLDEGHPDAVWDIDREVWIESDAALRRRILAALEAPPLPHVTIPDDVDV